MKETAMESLLQMETSMKEDLSQILSMEKED